MTLLQLFHDGVVPVDRARPVEVIVDGVVQGRYLIEWLRRNEEYGWSERALFRLRRLATSEDATT